MLWFQVRVLVGPPNRHFKALHLYKRYAGGTTLNRPAAIFSSEPVFRPHLAYHPTENSNLGFCPDRPQTAKNVAQDAVAIR